jgi:hypothetical protein
MGQTFGPKMYDIEHPIEMIRYENYLFFCWPVVIWKMEGKHLTHVTLSLIGIAVVVVVVVVVDVRMLLFIWNPLREVV